MFSRRLTFGGLPGGDSGVKGILGKGGQSMAGEVFLAALVDFNFGEKSGLDYYRERLWTRAAEGRGC